MKYICETCGSVYDEQKGDPKRGIPQGTKFCDLPYYSCPGCGAEKEAFGVRTEDARLKVDPQTNSFWHAAKYGDDNAVSDR